MVASFRLKSLIPTEDAEQSCLFQWAATQRWQGKPLNSLIIMIPNGAYLGGDPRQRAITMARLKRMGFRNGVFDLLIPIPRAPYPGFFLELKRTNLSVVSDDQKDFQTDMEALGWKTAICKGWEAARKAITEYLA